MNIHTVVFSIKQEHGLEKMYFLGRDEYNHDKLILWDTAPLSSVNFPRPTNVLDVYAGGSLADKTVASLLHNKLGGELEDYLYMVKFLRGA